MKVAGTKVVAGKWGEGSESVSIEARTSRFAELLDVGTRERGLKGSAKVFG
jgi:hypothetical protein